MAIALVLAGIAALLAVSVLALILRRRAGATPVVYGLSAATCLVLLGVGVTRLLGGGGDDAIVLPLGIPWIGAHFRLDALSAFFLAVVASAAPARASTPSATAGTSPSRSGCCRSTRPS